MSTFGRFIALLRPYRRKVLIGLLLSLIYPLLSLPVPLALEFLVDRIIGQRQIHLLLYLFLFLVLLQLVRNGVAIIFHLNVAYLGQRLVLDLRHKIFRHLLQLPLGFYEKVQTGNLISKIIDDVDVVQTLVSVQSLNSIMALTTVVMVTGIIFFKNWQLAIITLAVIPLLVVNYFLFLRHIRSSNRRVREKMDEIVGNVQEKIAAVQVIKAFSQERHEKRLFTSMMREKLSMGISNSVYGIGFSSLAIGISGFGTALVLWAGGLQVQRGDITIGQLLAFNALVVMLYTPLMQLSQINASIQQGVTSLERIFELLDEPDDMKEQPDALALEEVRGEVDFDHVSFGYLPGQGVLHDIDMHIDPGQMVALVGHTGSGKSSIVNLLLRFYDADEGTVRVDGHDVRDLRLRSLRDRVGIVLQDPLLFNISIRENIAYGRPTASLEEVEAAARAAEIHDFILTLPSGYDTRLGEEGIKISMGEKQRLSIARAILKQPRILVLDEATSALDIISEGLIQKALQRVMQGRTSIVIAHRLSTIVRADKIVVLENGRVVQTGSHAELVQVPGLYRNFYLEQFEKNSQGLTREMREDLLS